MGHFTCASQEVEVGDRLTGGTVAAIQGAASPTGRVTFTFTDGTTDTARYGGTVIVLTGTVA